MLGQLHMLSEAEFLQDFRDGRRDFSGMDFYHVDLRDTDLCGVNFERARFFSIGLFHRANLEGVNFMHAELMGCNFFGANLRNANLTDANLMGANLLEANFDGADFWFARMPPLNWLWFPTPILSEWEMRNWQDGTLRAIRRTW